MSESSQKRILLDSDSVLHNIKAIVLTVEGTAILSEFVKEIMEEYFENHLKEFIKTSFKDLKNVFNDFRQEVKKNLDKGLVEVPSDEDVDGVIVAMQTNALCLLKSHPDNVALASLLVQFWPSKLQNGDIKADIYDDVAPTIHEFLVRNIKVYGYSMLPINVQKALFANSTHGDISDLFTGYFDYQAAGLNSKKATYKKIAADINIPEENILFLTEEIDEANAANEAGLKICMVARDETSIDENCSYRLVTSFDELFDDEDEDDCDVPYKRLRSGEEQDAQHYDDEDASSDTGDEK